MEPKLMTAAEAERSRVEATSSADKKFRITASTSTSATIEVTDTGSHVGNSRFGSGVSNLVLQTTTAGGSSVRVATDEPSALPDLPSFSSATSLTIQSLGANDAIYLGGADNAGVTATIHTGAGGDQVYLSQDNDADFNTTATIDFDSNLGGGLGSGNLLDMASSGSGPSGVNCTATLAQFAGTTGHTMYIDEVIVSNTVFVMPPSPPTLTPATLNIENTDDHRRVQHRRGYWLVGPGH